MKWRVIMTDSESLTGVAPECDDLRHPTDDTGPHGVYDCCPHPHIECWHEPTAQRIANALTDADAEQCS